MKKASKFIKSSAIFTRLLCSISVITLASKQTLRKSAALKPKFCCRPKLNLLFSALSKFPPKIIESFISKQKNANQPKITNSRTILNIFELVFLDFPCSFSVHVKIFGHIFFYFMGRLFWLFCYRNQSINRFFCSAQFAVNGKFCRFPRCLFRRRIKPEQMFKVYTRD